MITMIGFGMAFGILIVLSGILSMIRGRTLLFFGDRERYTEESLQMYARLSGAVRILMGLGLMMIFAGNTSLLSVVVSWSGASVVWLTLSACITLYLIVPVKRRG